MLYRAIGVMSGSSLDGLDIVFVEFDETAGEWNYAIKAAACYEYEEEWLQKLQQAKVNPSKQGNHPNPNAN